MVLHPIIRPLGLASSILGLLQSLAWLVMSIIGILMYSDVLVFEYKPSYAGYRNEMIYKIYFKDEALFTDIIIERNEMLIFLIIYVVLSLAWLCTSCVQVKFLLDRKWKPIKNSFIAWAVIALLVFLVDLSLTIILALDYSKAIEFFRSGHAQEFFRIIATGTIMTLGARGYVLLAVNLLTIIFMFVAAFTLNNEEKSVYGDRVKPINAYQSHSPSTYFSEVTNIGHSIPHVSHINGAYLYDDQYTGLTRSRSMVESRPASVWSDANYENRRRQDPWAGGSTDNTRQQQPWSYVNNTNTNTNRVAKIGNSGKRSPPMNKVLPPTVPPTLPHPDYTPPASPKQHMRSLLKTNRQYAA